MLKRYTLSVPFKQKIDKYFGYLLIALLLPPTRFLGIVMRRNHKLNTTPQKILFIKLLGIGSLVISSPAIRLMRQRFPNAQFILLTDTNIANAITPLHLFDETWAVRSDRAWYTLLDGFIFLLRSWKLRQLWVVDLEVYSKLTTVYALLTCAINRFGFYLAPVFFRKYLNTHNVWFDQSAVLEDNYQRMAKEVIQTDAQEVQLPPIQRQQETSMPYLAINNTCSDLALVRKLPPTTIAAVCDWLLQHTSYKLVLLGAPSDYATNEQLLIDYPVLDKSRIVNYAGTVGFHEYYRFLSEQCALMLTIDSGPLHVAKTLGLPTVSVWGPTHPEQYLKIHPEEKRRHLFYYSQVHCSPCVHRHETLPCGGHNFCMQDTTADQIILLVKKVLSELN